MSGLRISSGDPVFTFDDELRVLSWNPAAERLTGIAEADGSVVPAGRCSGRATTTATSSATQAAPTRGLRAKAGPSAAMT